MRTTTQVEVWPTDTPFVVYIIPPDDPMRYAALMDYLTRAVQTDLGWDEGTIETVGLIASTPEHVKEGLYFLDDLGVDPRRVTLLVMWGDTIDAIGFEKEIPVECGVGYVALPKSGVVLPILRMPFVGDWWSDPLHQSYAEVSYGEMVREGRVRPSETEQMMCISSKGQWN